MTTPDHAAAARLVRDASEHGFEHIGLRCALGECILPVPVLRALLAQNAALVEAIEAALLQLGMSRRTTAERHLRAALSLARPKEESEEEYKPTLYDMLNEFGDAEVEDMRDAD